MAKKKTSVKTKSAKKKNKPKLTEQQKRRAAFVKLLIELSMKEAGRSTGAIKDIFLQQALRLDAELERLEGQTHAEEVVKGTA